MATQILRTIDRWRFEAPLAIALAAAAGFAVMAMPHEIFGRVPVASDYGRAGHAALAVLAALVCGTLGYVAMRRPRKPVVVEDEEYIEDLHAPVDLPVATPVEDEPLRLRRADRHPDAPPRAPIRASRDLGEPFMEVGTPEAPEASAIADAEFTHVEPIEAEHPVSADDVEAVPPVVHAPAEPELATTADEVVMDEPVAQDGEPVAELSASKAAIEEPAAVEPERVEQPVAVPVPATPAAPRDDSSLAAMMERLSAGVQRRGGDPVGRPLGSPRPQEPALRDALAELNRLAERRG